MLKLKSALSRKNTLPLLLADRSIPTHYFTLLLPKARTCTLCSKLNVVFSFCGVRSLMSFSLICLLWCKFLFFFFTLGVHISSVTLNVIKNKLTTY